VHVFVCRLIDSTVFQQEQCQWFHVSMCLLAKMLKGTGESSGPPEQSAIKHLIYFNLL